MDSDRLISELESWMKTYKNIFYLSWKLRVDHIAYDNTNIVSNTEL